MLKAGETIAVFYLLYVDLQYVHLQTTLIFIIRHVSIEYSPTFYSIPDSILK